MSRPRGVHARLDVIDTGHVSTPDFVRAFGTPAVFWDGDERAVFGVDSGLISVFDRALLERLGGAAVLDAVPAMADQIPPDAMQARIVPAPGLTSVFVCQAGKGDGAYLGWWGLGDDGS